MYEVPYWESAVLTSTTFIKLHLQIGLLLTCRKYLEDGSISLTEVLTIKHLHDRTISLRNRLLDQGYKKIRLIRSLKKFIFRYQYLVEIYSVSAEKIMNDGFSCSENVLG